MKIRKNFWIIGIHGTKLTSKIFPHRNWGSLRSKVQCINNSAFLHVTIKKVPTPQLYGWNELKSICVITIEVPILIKHLYSLETNWNLLVLILSGKSCLLEVPQITLLFLANIVIYIYIFITMKILHYRSRF
jgi:hypothetical protein